MRTISAGQISISTGMLLLAGTLSAYSVGADTLVAAPPLLEDGKAGVLHAGADVYGIVNLGAPFGFFADINERGQAAFEFYSNLNQIRVGFFNGERIIDITPPGQTEVLMGGLNDKGEVVFSSHATPSGAPRTEPFRPYRWSPSRGAVPLAPLGSGDSFPAAINNRSEIVGYANLTADGNAYRAVRWTATNRLIPLPASAGIGQTFASHINNYNVSTGIGAPDAGGARLLRWDAAGKVADLGTLGATVATGQLINDRGDIAGMLDVGNPNVSAFILSPGKGVARAGAGTVAHQLNQVGDLVGRRLGADFQPRAFLFSRGRGLLDLHPKSFLASEAHDVNDNGVVVGQATRTDQQRAYRWSRSGGAVDLNTRLLNPPAGLVLSSALAISNNGDIVANSNAGVLLLRARGGGTDAPVLGPLLLAPRLNQPAELKLSFRDRNARDTHTATVDWGDGKGPRAATVYKAGGNSEVRSTHVFTENGDYEVAVSVRDSSGKTTVLKEHINILELGTPGAAAKGAAQVRAARTVTDPRAPWTVGRLPAGAVPPVK